MHPYSKKPAQNFWRRFVSDTAWRELDLIGKTKFQLQPGTRVSTAGSCFAQHISRHMRQRGMDPFKTELAHPLSVSAGVDTSSYEAFSARYGNIYTSRQCLELFQQAFGLRPMIEDFVWQEERVYDLLRPNVLVGGFASMEEALADRVFHLRKVREMFEQTDVFVFTLGLTESWYHSTSDHTYPVCPGTARGEYDASFHRFRNLTHSEVAADLRALVSGLLQFNPTLKIIFTVSPVPLVATYTANNVLVASMYSKSVLRGACGEVADQYGHVQYFPSYEIISHSASFGQYLQGDLREVTERGVSHVMDSFFKAFYAGTSSFGATVNIKDSGADHGQPDVASMLNAECEEMFNDQQR
jgi:hypothetical protein